MSETSDDVNPAIGDAQFRSLLDRANDGLFLIDAETGAIDGANRTVCEWLGYDEDEVLDLTIFDCQATFDDPGEWQTFVERVHAEDGVRLENEITTRSGSTIPVEGSISVAASDGSEYVVAIPRRIENDE